MRVLLRAKEGPQTIIRDYLEENASDELVEKINSGYKTMDECWDYIYNQARENSKGNSVCFEDKVVFGWAVHFFEEEGNVKPEKKETPVKIPEKEVEVKKAVVKKEDDLQQITLFDLMGNG